MNQTPANPSGTSPIFQVPCWVAGVVALLSTVLYYLQVRHGIAANPDSWAYWESAVAFVERGSYCYFGGELPVCWPPLFSLYLALFQWLGGSTGQSLILAMTVLNFGIVWIWAVVLLDYARRTLPAGLHPLLWAVGLGFVAVFVPWCGLWVLANYLNLLFAGLLVLALLRLETAAGFSFWGLAAVAALAGGLCVLSHNSSLAYVPPAVLVALLLPRLSWPRRLGVVGLLGFAVVGWKVSRVLLGQGNSHALGLPPKFAMGEHLYQSVRGLGGFFLSTQSADIPSLFLGLGLLAFLFAGLFSRSRFGSVTAKVPFIMALGVWAGLYVIFNVTWLDTNLDGRFLFYFPLCLLPPMLVWLQSQPRLVWAPVLLLLITVPLLRGLKYVDRKGPDNPQTIAQGSIDIRSWYAISGRPDYQPAVGFVRVRPPTYRFLQRWDPAESPFSQEFVREYQPSDAARFGYPSVR